MPVSERYDHAAAACKHIDWAHEQQAQDGEYDYSVRDNALIAQAEATLALVEQQRIANLIAWSVGAGYTPGAALSAEIVAGLHMPLETEREGWF